MNNNKLIKKEKVSIFCKISNFFKRIFCSENNSIIENQYIEKNTLKEDLKVNLIGVDKKENKLEDFLKKFEKNPDMVEKLTDDGLDKIINYYENIIIAKKDKIERLKKSLN